MGEAGILSGLSSETEEVYLEYDKPEDPFMPLDSQSFPLVSQYAGAFNRIDRLHRRMRSVKAMARDKLREFYTPIYEKENYENLKVTRRQQA